MKTLDAGLAAHIAQTVTTLSNCWKVERLDGVVMGFTDHDKDLIFGGVTYQASSGFSASALEAAMGLAATNLEAAGALSSASITEADIGAGRYDNAKVTIYRVNWRDVSQRVIVRKGFLGQVQRGKAQYTAELRGLASPLDQSCGRTFQRTCQWKLGDGRCQVDLSASGRHGTGAVTAINNQFDIIASGLGAFASGAFERGVITWTSGANDGQTMDLTGSLLTGSSTLLSLMIPMGEPVAIGDAFTITVGCDWKSTTCQTKFGNIANFGGFPDMPGNDFASTYAVPGSANDGSALT
jgi:uncharacterized phage protein (TIGR02218 family)